LFFSKKIDIFANIENTVTGTVPDIANSVYPSPWVWSIQCMSADA